MDFTITGFTASGIMDALTAADAPLDAAKLWAGFFTDGPSVDPPVNWDDFTAPPVTDFNKVSLTPWSAKDLQDDGSYQRTSPVLDFFFDLFTAPTNFIGMFLANSATVGTVIGWMQFNDFIQFLNGDMHAKFVIRITVFLDGTYRLDALRIDG